MTSRELEEKFMALVRTSTRIEQTLLRHVEAFAKGDLDALMSDYCQDAVLITPDGVLRGSGEIETFFEELWLTSPLVLPLKCHSASPRGRWPTSSGRVDRSILTSRLPLRPLWFATGRF